MDKSIRVGTNIRVCQLSTRSGWSSNEYASSFILGKYLLDSVIYAHFISTVCTNETSKYYWKEALVFLKRII